MRYPVRIWTAIGVLGNSIVALVCYFAHIEEEAQLLITVVVNAAIGVAVAITAEGAVTPLADPRLEVGTSYKATTPGDANDVVGVEVVTG